MKKLVFSLMTLFAAGAANADFQSIVCGDNETSLIKRHDGSGFYDLSLSGPFSMACTEGLICYNLPNSGDGTYVSLVTCFGAKGERVHVTHNVTDYTELDSTGKLVSKSTPKAIQFHIWKEGMALPYVIKGFLPAQCKQTN